MNQPRSRSSCSPCATRSPGWEALSALSQEDRDKALELLLDPVDGARFTYGRISEWATVNVH